MAMVRVGGDGEELSWPNTGRIHAPNIGGRGIRAIIDTERALKLAKSARVLLDEAEMTGLGYSVKLRVKKTVSNTDSRRVLHVTRDTHVVDEGERGSAGIRECDIRETRSRGYWTILSGTSAGMTFQRESCEFS